MDKRAFYEFTSDLGRDFIVEFWRDSFLGTPIELIAGVGGFTLEYDGSTTDTHEPILASSFKCKIVATTAADETFFDEVRSLGEGAFQIRITAGRIDTPAIQNSFWNGVLLDEINDRDEFPSVVTLEGTDDLGLLKEVLYKINPASQYQDTADLIVMISRCLSKVRWWSIFSATETAFKVNPYITNSEIVGTPIEKNVLVNHLNLRNVTTAGVPKYFDTYTILENVLRNMQSRIMQADGMFWILPLGELGTASFNVHSYKTDGTGDNSPRITEAETAGTTNTSVFSVFNVNTYTKFATVEFGLLSPLQFVESRHAYNGHAWDWYGAVPGDVVSGGMVNVNAYGATTTLDVGDIVSINMRLSATLDAYGLSSGDRGRRFKLSFRLRHGAVYAARSVDPMTSGGAVVQNTYSTESGNHLCFAVQQSSAFYNTTTTNRIEMWSPVFDRYSETSVDIFETLVLPAFAGTPGLTMIGDVQAHIYDADGVLQTSEDVNFNTYGFSEIYQTHGSSSIDGDSVVYRREISGSTARESLDLGTVMFGDRISDLSNVNANIWAINTASGYQQSGPDWGNTKYSVQTPIASLVGLDILSMRSEPMTTAVAAVRQMSHNIHRTFILPGYTGIWIHFGGSFEAGSGIWETDLFLYQYDTTIGTNPVTDVAYTLGLVPAIGKRSDTFGIGNVAAIAQKVRQVEAATISNEQTAADANVSVSNRTATLETDVALIQRTTDASGGLSDVHLEYLGDVKISGPTNGQILEYSTAAGRWGNVTSGGGGGGVTAVSGTAPVVSSGGTTPDISITASTTGAAGSMSATDKTKIDGIETGAQVNVNADWNAASGDAEILNKPAQFPSDHALWIGTGTSSAGANVYSLSVTENYIPWATRLKNLYNVAVDTGSNCNTDKEYVIPATGLYEMNIFMVVINTAGSDGTLCKLIAAVGTNGTAQQLCARTTKTISAGQYDGTGGTVVFQGTAGDKITPALYFRRNGTGGTFKLSYFNDYLHAAIRRIN